VHSSAAGTDSVSRGLSCQQGADTLVTHQRKHQRTNESDRRQVFGVPGCNVTHTHTHTLHTRLSVNPPPSPPCHCRFPCFSHDSITAPQPRCNLAAVIHFHKTALPAHHVWLPQVYVITASWAYATFHQHHQMSCYKAGHTITSLLVPLVPRAPQAVRPAAQRTASRLPGSPTPSWCAARHCPTVSRHSGVVLGVCKKALQPLFGAAAGSDVVVDSSRRGAVELVVGERLLHTLEAHRHLRRRHVTCTHTPPQHCSNAR